MREQVLGPKIKNLVKSVLMRNYRLNPQTSEHILILILLASKLSITRKKKSLAHATSDQRPTSNNISIKG